MPVSPTTGYSPTPIAPVPTTPTAGNTPVVRPTAVSGGNAVPSGVLNQAAGITNPTPISLTGLTPTNGTASLGTAYNGTAANVGTAPVANASNVGPQAGITNGQINANDSTNSAAQLDAITNANSPYIQLAQQQGMLSAASRGLQNSSLGAGAAEASAVAAAAPFAQQNASTASAGQMQNSQLQTQANEFNASQQNSNNQLNAQMQTQNSQFNASQNTQNSQVNAQAQNSMKMQTQQLTEALNQQFVSGEESKQLASINGQYNTLINSNSSAASLYKSYMDNMGAILNNKDIDATKANVAITTMMKQLTSGLALVDAMNGGSSVAPPPVTAPTPTAPTLPRVGGPVVKP
jgi:hypothetical protein